MPSLVTTITEVVTGLAMLGTASLEEVLADRPPVVANLAPADWQLLSAAHQGGAHAENFAAAWANGRFFLEATDGLRGRRPHLVEWKGSTRPAGDDNIPADLRIDRVYLISCKYLSRIMLNASPQHLFERLLSGGHGVRAGEDWFERCAPTEHQALYAAARGALGGELPTRVSELDRAQRRWLAGRLKGPLPASLTSQYAALTERVALTSAGIWRDRLSSDRGAEALLWRMLRIHAVPYFVLGASPAGSLRLRIDTPWDWRQRYRVRGFDIAAQPGGQARVAWSALVSDRFSGRDHQVGGHVEIRWSHGRFGGPPEAKVYLDTPHDEIPGYHRLSGPTEQFSPEPSTAGSTPAVGPATQARLWLDLEE